MEPLTSAEGQDPLGQGRPKVTLTSAVIAYCLVRTPAVTPLNNLLDGLWLE